KKVKVHLDDVDKLRWAEDLTHDLIMLGSLLQKIQKISPANDAKLVKLKEKIFAKIENPFNCGNRKVIIFTAFADTANYLYGNLAPLLKEKYDINTALISGSKKISTSAKVNTELNTLLTFFSPRSKDKDLLFPDV